MPDGANAYPAYGVVGPVSASATGQIGLTPRDFSAFFIRRWRLTLMRHRRVLGQCRARVTVLSTRFAHFFQSR